MFTFKSRKTPKTLDTKSLMRAISRGAEAKSILNTLGPRIQDWKDWIFDCIAGAEPDGMIYAKYAGMIEMLRTMEKELTFQHDQGEEATKTLESGKKVSA